MMQANPGGLLTLLEQHLNWYPLMELRDIYKLLYQGVMGSEHLLSGEQQFIKYLQDEFIKILPDASLRLLEPVRTDRAMFRVNLSAYKAQKASIDHLAKYLVETARIRTGTIDELRAVWINFVSLCIQGHICGFDANILSRFSQRLEGANYPTVHHSDAYRKAYMPAYRILAVQYIPEINLDASGGRESIRTELAVDKSDAEIGSRTRTIV